MVSGDVVGKGDGLMLGVGNERWWWFCLVIMVGSGEWLVW